MGDVVERRELMLHGVHAPSLGLAAVGKAIDGPAAGPHEVGAGLPVGGIRHGDGCELDDGAQQALHEGVQEVEVLVLGEVGLAGVADDVCRAGRRLERWHRIGVLRI